MFAEISHELTTAEKQFWELNVFSCRCCQALPGRMNNTMKRPNSRTEIFQVSKCMKNRAFFSRERSSEDSDPWISISVCMIKTLMTEELITRRGWGPCIFVCSSTVNVAVSTQTQTTPQICLFSQAVCNILCTLHLPLFHQMFPQDKTTRSLD